MLIRPNIKGFPLFILDFNLSFIFILTPPIFKAPVGARGGILYNIIVFPLYVIYSNFQLKM